MDQYVGQANAIEGDSISWNQRHVVVDKQGGIQIKRMSYAVQGLNEMSRARRKAAKLRSRLKGSIALPRPRGRNRIDMVRRLRDAELQAKTLYLDRLRDLADRSDARRMPGDGNR